MSWHDVWLGLQLNWLGLIAAVAVAVTCAYLGVFVVLRRIVFVGLALAQVSGAGVALAFLLGPAIAALGHQYVHSLPPFHHIGVCLEWLAIRPIVISLVLTLIGTWLLARQSWTQRLPKDSIIGAGYVTAYALTLIFILKSPKGLEEVRELLDGSVLTASASDVVLMMTIFGVVLGIHGLLYKQLLFVSFDPESAAAQGYRVPSWELLFYVTLGVTITVAMIYAGILAAFAYMVIPPIVGLVSGGRMGSVIAVAVTAAITSAIIGFVLALKWDLPLSPPTIGTGLLLALVASFLRRRH